jgi:hypothetical protein
MMEAVRTHLASQALCRAAAPVQEKGVRMKLLLPTVLGTLLFLCGCTTTTTSSDIVLVKTEMQGPRCAAPAEGACASCATACPALNQALCIGGTSVAGTGGGPASCTVPASCGCVALSERPPR